MRPPFIVTTPIRNEAWILEKFLGTTSLWADHILILDSGCNDQSLEICQRFPKVKVLPFQSHYPTSEYHRRHDLFYAAREIHSQAIVFTLDADEILSAEILDQSTQNQLVDTLHAPGSSLSLPWIMLWKNALEYRTEPNGVWSDRRKRCVYWDDAKADYPFEGFLHFPPVPRQFHDRTTPFNLPLLHYQFSAWKRTQIKQIHWRILEWEKGPQSLLNSIRINLLYAIARETWDEQTSPIPQKWILNYEHHGLILSNSFDDSFPWFIEEILLHLAKYKKESLSLLDIWDLPWEIYRQKLAPSNPLLHPLNFQDPRSNLQKTYHHLIHLCSYFGSTLALRIYRFYSPL